MNLVLFSLGSYSKLVSDEGNLLADVSFAHSSDLPFSQHVHDLEALECSPRRLEGKEAHPWLRQAFDAHGGPVR
jgi:hypothetical protein